MRDRLIPCVGESSFSLMLVISSRISALPCFQVPVTCYLKIALCMAIGAETTPISLVGGKPRCASRATDTPMAPCRTFSIETSAALALTCCLIFKCGIRARTSRGWQTITCVDKWHIRNRSHISAPTFATSAWSTSQRHRVAHGGLGGSTASQKARAKTLLSKAWLHQEHCLGSVSTLRARPQVKEICIPLTTALRSSVKIIVQCRNQDVSNAAACIAPVFCDTTYPTCTTFIARPTRRKVRAER